MVLEVVLTLEILPPIEIVAFELPYTSLDVPVAVRMEPSVVLPTMLYAGPVIPVGPVKEEPVGPVDPVTPVGPVKEEPVGPVDPVAPVTPVGPVKEEPVGPVDPVAPVTPVGPVKEEPVGPVDPVAPVTPVGPVKEEPVGPVDPVKEEPDGFPTYGRADQKSLPLPIFIWPVSVATLGSPMARTVFDAVQFSVVSRRSRN